MANINKKPSHVANLGRSGHDMGQTLKFTSSVGHLLPVYYDFLNPGETVTIDSELISKTVRPLKSPALTQIDEYLDWFFVPMNCLYSLFEQVYYSINDMHSSMFDPNQLVKDFPSISIIDFFESNINCWSRQWVSGIDTVEWSDSDGASDVDEFGVPRIQNVMRLCQLLGYSSSYFDDLPYVTQFAGAPKPVSLAAWLPAAYQAIFYSYYRLTDWQNNDISAYNLDQYYNAPTIDGSVIDKLFKIHYRPLKKDFFTNLYPAPLVDNTSIGMLGDRVFDASLVNDPKNVPNSGTTANYGPVGQVTVNSLSGSQGTAKLRGMFALEKLLEITRRAGKHVDDQVLAHFGVQTPRRRSGEVIHIGSSTAIMNVSQLQATATSENSGGTSTLGEYAGNLDSHMRSGKMKFSSGEDHGILMCIYSAVPRADYSTHTALDKINTIVDSSSLYFPEFDNLGMVPQYRYQAAFAPKGWEPSSDPQTIENNTILGWQYRYMEYKQKYNRVAGGLLFDLSYWTTMRNSFQLNDVSGQVLDPYSPYRFYCSPKMLNPLVVAEFPYTYRGRNFDPDTPNEWTSEDIKADFTSLPNAFVNDPLVHMIAFDVKKVSTMSVYSLPKL